MEHKAFNRLINDKVSFLDFLLQYPIFYNVRVDCLIKSIAKCNLKLHYTIEIFFFSIYSNIF